MPANRFALLLVAAVSLAVLAVPLAPSLQAAQTTQKTGLFLNLTSDDAWTAQMAFTYAGMVLERGHPVTVFLNVRGVRLADKNVPQRRDGVTGKAPRTLLRALIDKGATVYVCAMCTKEAGMTQEDWIDGVKPGGPETIQAQMAPSTKVMSY